MRHLIPRPGQHPADANTNDVAMVQEEKVRVLDQAVEVLRRRVDKFGVAEPEIRLEGEDQIRVQLPGLSEADKEAAKSQIQRAAYLEFRIVHPESNRYLAQGLTAPGYEVLRVKRRARDGQGEVWDSYLVKKKPERGLTGHYVQRAMVTTDTMTGEVPSALIRKGLRFCGNPEHVGHQLAIVLDGELYSAPNINEPIPSGNASIGDFTLKEAFELANAGKPLEALSC
jgi:SecD/SecF fusion protein